MCCKGRKLLDSTVGRVVLLLPVAPASSENELEASVERLFDEGGSADQVDSAADDGQEGDYGASSEATICGKSSSAFRELLASSLLNVEVGVAALPILPMVTSSVSATPEHESGAHDDYITGLNICTIGAFERFVISSDSSRHSSTHASKAEGDSIFMSAAVPPVITEAVVTSHAVNVPLVLEMGVKVTSLVQFNVGIARQACLNVEVRMRTEYCLSKMKRLESECEKQADLLKKMHVSEIDALKQKNVALENKKGSLNEKVVELQSSVSTKDLDLKELNAALSSLRSQNDGLVDQVHALEATCSGLREQLSGYENLTNSLEEFQDAQLKAVNDKVAKLDADLAEMACHLEEKFYPHLLSTISGQRWLLTYGLKLVLVKCLNSLEYLTALGAAINRAFKKGMQDGLAAGIDHGREGRSLADVVAYNPSAEADFNSAIQELCRIDFPLLVELKSHKDASVEDIMNLLRLEGPLADAPGMGDLQPDIEQLKIRANIAPERHVPPPASLLPLSLQCPYPPPFPLQAPSPLTVDDYEIVHADLDTTQESSQGNVQGDAATVEFEKDDLDTTSEPVFVLSDSLYISDFLQRHP
nr:hypothetical protein [Tanacetum cinerariifolium]